MSLSFSLRRTALALAAIPVIALGLTACSGSKSDPATADRDDLNSPGALVTVTQSAGLELRWTGQNAEKDFQGYHVFATTTSFAELAELVAYPAGAKERLSRVGIPRCEDNSKFFEAFGFKPTTKSCSGATDAEEEGDEETFAFQGLQGASTDGEEEESSTTESGDEVLSNFIKCGTGSESDISLVAIDGAAIGSQKCLITEAYDPATEKNVTMTNGTSYVTFAVAVMGSKKNKISWTSNVVSDTPSALAYSDTLTFSGATTSSKFFVVTIDDETFEASVGTAQNCSSVSNKPCDVDDKNTATADGIYIARDNTSSTFKDRLFVSAKSGGSYKLALRGPITVDPLKPTEISARVPQDAATEDSIESPYKADGTNFTVGSNTVFDFTLGTGANRRYGKIVFGDVGAVTGTDNTSDVKAEVTIIVQPKTETTDYFQ